MTTRILVVDDSQTIRKVVTAILARRGYEATSAADGQHALDVLSDSQRFDLVLLDFVMPRMNGYQFCRAVRGQDRFRALPIVLMSAKSDKIREQFVQQTGAIDAITKPFDAQALVAVIENALKRVEFGSPRVPVTGTFEDGEPSSLHAGPHDDSARVARSAVELGARLAKVIAPALGTLPVGAVGDEAQIGAALASRLSLDLLREIGLSIRDFDFGEQGVVVLSGDLGALPIGAVLQMVQVERQSGVLAVTRPTTPHAPGSEVTVTWRNGFVDLVQSRGAGDEFRLGRFFIEEGLVTSEEIEALLQAKALPAAPVGRGSGLDLQGPPLLGDVLVDAGRISEQQLRSALVRQASELIYEVLRWQRGRFEFRRQGASPLAERAKLSLPIASIVMEGFRRVDEWRVIEAGLGSFEGVLQRDPMAIAAIQIDQLPRAERGVLDAIDGERTVREIVGASHMSSFDACRVLCQFVEARLVRPRVT